MASNRTKLFHDNCAGGQPLANLVAAIDAGRGGANLSLAIRLFVLNAMRRST